MKRDVWHRIYMSVLRRVVRGARIVSSLLMMWGTYVGAFGDIIGTQRLLFDLGFVNWLGKKKEVAIKNKGGVK